MPEPPPPAAPPVATAPDLATLSFEEALAELERIVRQLEDGRSRLDDAIALYERGCALRHHCESRLREAHARIERITIAADGTVASEPARLE